ncbi:hypothetical protein IM40_04105 [Candidatus Paracaedimonas acanthamoebae]|nr:hypothetical protein IM40_04105 [Candidatus Paracaedimonas acanthamoebae]
MILLKKKRVQAKIKSLGSLIPVTSPSPSEEPKKAKRKFSLSLISLKGSSSSIKKDDSSSSSSSPRSESPKKQDTILQSPSSLTSRLRGFSYTAGGSTRSSSSPSLTQIDIQPLSSSLEDDKVTNSTKLLPEASKSDSIKSPRSRNNSFKKDISLSAPVAKAAFVTIKDPETELTELLKIALTLCGSVLEPLNETEHGSNERVELVVKSMLADLKSSIKNITTKKEQSASILDPKQRTQELGDPVSFFRMTVNRAMTQIPSAVKWALGQPSENSDLLKYFEKMFEDAQKTQEAILHEHNTTKLTLMKLGQALYLELVTKGNEQKGQNIAGRNLVVDNFLREYTTYLNGMHDQLRQAIGKTTLFNALNREFNPTILLMHSNLLKVLNWAVGKEEDIDVELQIQLNKN